MGRLLCFRRSCAPLVLADCRLSARDYLCVMIFDRLAIAAAALLVSSAAVHAAPAPSGLWSLSNGKAQIRISDCGGSLCATLVGLRKPNAKDGTPKRDRKNPDPALRGRPVIGLPLVDGMRFDGVQWSGRFYNPDDGRTYAGRISADGPNRLKLKGCVVGLLCKTQSLTRLD